MKLKSLLPFMWMCCMLMDAFSMDESLGNRPVYAITGGTVSAVVTKVVAGEIFPSLINTVAPSGADPLVTPFSYQWEYSTNGSTWMSISGATGSGYTGSTLLTLSTFFRRKVSQNTETAYSNTVLIEVESVLNGGLIGSPQIVNPGAIPAALTNMQAPAGGNGSFSFQWESSPDQITWTGISGATGLVYAPAALSASSYFRRKVVSGIQSRFSNPICITVRSTTNINKPTAVNGAASQPNEPIPDYSTLPNGVLNSVTAFSIYKPGLQNPGRQDLYGKPRNEVSMTVSYLDGYMRPVQLIDVGATKSGNDVVYLSQFDQFGRESVSHVPYVAETDEASRGSFRKNAHLAQVTSNQAVSGNQESHFFSKNTMEASPVNRFSKSMMPGKMYAGSANGQLKIGRTNTTADAVRVWNIGFAEGDLPQSTATFAPGSLWVEETIDESGAATTLFMDLEGKTILQSVEMGNATRLMTYFVYDGMGFLRYAISPLIAEYCQLAANWTFSTTESKQILADNATRYSYDDRGRNIIRMEPGMGGETHLVYDARDRLVFQQDPLMRDKGQGEWLMYIYDVFDRPVMLASYKNAAATRASLQTAVGSTVTSQSITFRNAPVIDLFIHQRESGRTSYQAKASIELHPGFESETNSDFTIEINPNLLGASETMVVANNTASITGYTPITILYYDNYNWPEAHTFNTGMVPSSGQNDFPIPFTSGFSAVGKITGMKTKVIGSEKILTSTFFYDDHGNHIQTQAGNITGGVDVTSHRYDFSGKMLGVYHSQNNLRSLTHKRIDLSFRYVYNKNNRMTEIYLSSPVGGNVPEKRLAAYDYDEMGHMLTRQLGNLETLTYQYTFDGQLKGINAPYARGENNNNYFGIDLYYDQGFTAPRMDGLISGIKWRRKGNPDEMHGFGYLYDNANRLLNADYSQKSGTEYINSTVDYTGKYAYDANGNINSLKQSGVLPGKEIAVLDELQYTYGNSNRNNTLMAVKDLKGDKQHGDFADFDGGTGVNDYAYDDNGNLVLDKNRKILIVNDHYINKPVRISLENDPQTYLAVTYSAEGDKLEQEIKEDGVIVRYTYMNGFVYKNDVLMMFNHPEGRLRVNRSGQLITDYFITDHLNNTRAVLTEEINEVGYKATHEDNPQPVPPIPERDLFSFGQVPVPITAGTPLYDYGGVSNRKAVKLNGNLPETRIGTGKVLKVMAGDRIDVGVLSYYAANSAGNSVASNPVNQMLAQLANALIGPASIFPNGKGNVLVGAANGLMMNMDDMTTFMNNTNSQNPSNTVPKAYLNYVLFDDNFQMVSGSAIRVNNPGAVTPLTGVMNIQKNGYVYIYMSNDSPSDVFFDDLVVKHTTGHLLQEDTYYPYGGSIRSQSSMALNRLKQDYLFNGAERITELDLEIYDTYYRTLDPETGRWWQPDPMRENFPGVSSYNSNFNNPVNFTDPNGDIPSLFNINPWLGYGASMAIGATVGVLIADARGADSYGRQWAGVAGAVAGIGAYYGLSVVNWENVSMPAISLSKLKMPKISWEWMKKAAASKESELMVKVYLHVKHGHYSTTNGIGFLNHFNGHTIMEVPVRTDNHPLTADDVKNGLTGKKALFDFQPGVFKLNHPTKINDMQTEMLSQGKVNEEDISTRGPYFENAARSMGLTVFSITISYSKYAKLMESINKSKANPPIYGLAKTRCAGWATVRLRQAGVFNQFSRIAGWSPLPLRFMLRLGVKFGADVSTISHSPGQKGNRGEAVPAPVMPGQLPRINPDRVMPPPMNRFPGN